MKVSAIALLSLVLTGSAQAENHFECGNPPAVRWGTYYCVGGSYDARGNLYDVNFGTCSGSDEAGEAEPSEVVSIRSLRPEKSLKATSPEWRGAYAYDVSTEAHGAATLFLQPLELKKKGDGAARLKLFSRRGSKGVNLRCYFN